MCGLIFGKGEIFPQNNFVEKLTFNRLPFPNLVQEINKIWFPGRLIELRRYRIAFTYCTKWGNDE